MYINMLLLAASDNIYIIKEIVWKTTLIEQQLL